MSDAYSQALRFYLVRPIRSLQLGTFAAMGLLMTVTAMGHRNGGSGIPGFVFGGLFLSMTLWLMFREQVIGPGRRLLPNFVKAQVAAFAISSAVISALMVAAVSEGGSESVVHAAAVVGVFFACVGLLILTQSIILFGLFFILGYGPAVGLPGIAWSWITPGNAPTVLPVALLAVVLTVLAYFRTTEESAWYGSPNGNGLFPRATGDGNQPWVASQGRWLQRIRFRRTWPVDANATSWQRIKRWRSQSRLRWLLITAWYGAISLYFSWPMLHQTSLPSRVRPLPDMSILFLGTMVSQTWLLRWRYLESELLRPVARPAFIKQLGGAMAIDFAIAFAACVAIMAIPQFIVSPAQDAVYSVAIRATGYAGVFVLCFGFTALLLRYRSAGLLMLNFLALLPAGFLLLLPTESFELSSMIYFFTAVVALALIGIALTMHAYRLWLDVEFA